MEEKLRTNDYWDIAALVGMALRDPSKGACFEAMNRFIAGKDLVTYEDSRLVVEF